MNARRLSRPPAVSGYGGPAKAHSFHSRPHAGRCQRETVLIARPPAPGLTFLTTRRLSPIQLPRWRGAPPQRVLHLPHSTEGARQRSHTATGGWAVRPAGSGPLHRRETGKRRREVGATGQEAVRFPGRGSRTRAKVPLQGRDPAFRSLSRSSAPSRVNSRTTRQLSADPRGAPECGGGGGSPSYRALSRLLSGLLQPRGTRTPSRGWPPGTAITLPSDAAL